LDCRHTKYVFRTRLVAFKRWRYDANIMSAPSKLFFERVYRPSNSTNMREIGIGEHRDFHVVNLSMAVRPLRLRNMLLPNGASRHVNSDVRTPVVLPIALG
jgi:hypothetical protein